jgi:hypothetical protein
LQPLHVCVFLVVGCGVVDYAEIVFASFCGAYT